MFEDSEKMIKSYVKKIVTVSFIFCICLGVISLMMLIGGEGFGFALLLFSIIGAFISYLTGAFLYAFADLVEQSKLQNELLKEINNKLSSLKDVHND